jgi:FkbM family methyltransferase
MAYFINSDFKIPGQLKINGEYCEIKFINKESRGFIYEFTETCLNDCYQLKVLKRELKNVNNIIDVGANQGLFSIAARQVFPVANISCYEPNIQLQPVLSANAEKLHCKVYYEAVTKTDCMVELEFGATDMHTQSHYSVEGKIIGTAFKKVIERAGGKVDLLKLDCEGAEWELFEDEDSWKNIMALTMEYHLWAREGSSFDDIKMILEKLNFKILKHNPLSDSFGIVVAVKKS